MASVEVIATFAWAVRAPATIGSILLGAVAAMMPDLCRSCTPCIPASRSNLYSAMRNES